MRRREKEITERESLDEILDSAPILSLALRAEPAPYVVPVCFGRVGDTLYVHSALAGTKIDLLEADPVVGFCAVTDPVISAGATPCASTASGRSIVGTGRARIVQEEEERLRGLDAIMRHYGHGAGSSGERPAYRPESLARTGVIAIRMDTLHGKRV
ncbi:MAG TPA: pyridoxamine 5'-phosphate oxidase family protein [Spirochaetia bacterium]|nr:pyridoxamine 5'-phosphate oxidase family protein [Spirochaetia bacterium]